MDDWVEIDECSPTGVMSFPDEEDCCLIDCSITSSISVLTNKSMSNSVYGHLETSDDENQSTNTILLTKVTKNNNPEQEQEQAGECSKINQKIVQSQPDSAITINNNNNDKVNHSQIFTDAEMLKIKKENQLLTKQLARANKTIFSLTNEIDELANVIRTLQHQNQAQAQAQIQIQNNSNTNNKNSDNIITDASNVMDKLFSVFKTKSCVSVTTNTNLKAVPIPKNSAVPVLLNVPRIPGINELQKTTFDKCGEVLNVFFNKKMHKNVNLKQLCKMSIIKNKNYYNSNNKSVKSKKSHIKKEKDYQSIGHATYFEYLDHIALELSKLKTNIATRNALQKILRITFVLSALRTTFEAAPVIGTGRKGITVNGNSSSLGGRCAVFPSHLLVDKQSGFRLQLARYIPSEKLASVQENRLQQKETWIALLEGQLKVHVKNYKLCQRR